VYNKNVIKAFEEAKKVREQAHAPYSNFKVGACFKIKGEETYITGCNVENASFGATVCAERVALWNWASQKDRLKKPLDFLVLVTDTQNPVASPCGLCLQTLSEFLKPETPIYLANLTGIQKQLTFQDLLPYVFELAR
jgi:cytidine deaminase